MGSLYRSEDMVLCQMYLQSDATYNCIAQLGELGLVQFKDLKADVNIFQRQFVNEIRRCEEMERQLRFFEKELKKSELFVTDVFANPNTPAAREMIDLEAIFESAEGELRELNMNVESLERNYIELQELKYVLQYTDEFFLNASHEMELGYYGAQQDAGSAEADASRLQLNYVAGVIPLARIPGFTRLLWFASRGNIFVRHYVIPEIIKDPVTGDEVHKAVFLAVFQGDQLKSKVQKISDGFRATIYPCLSTYEERAELMSGLHQRMADLQTVLSRSREQRERTLRNLSQNIYNWDLKVLKLKAVYHTMNMFQNEGENFICECWMPYKDLGTIQGILDRSSELSGNRITSLVHPIEASVLPTYHKTNKFTRAFQAIIDAYGVACYKEVNPAGFSIITFPFLFAVMFGDAGHAAIMLLFALLLVCKESKLQREAEKSEMFGIIFAGRYMILVMALFSLYSGLIYNDVFSKSISIFGSKWKVSNATLRTCCPDLITCCPDLTLNPADNQTYARTPYEFGVDPVWQLSMNKISFTNSFKKKISVIFGVSQMLLGIMLSICNHIYFKRPLNIICEFIPQFLFLMAIFGYLCALVIVKWLIYLPEIGGAYYNCSPNILIGFINMFMMTYPDEEEACKGNWYPYPGMKPLQICLLLIAVISAVWMLLSKPVYLHFQHRQKLKRTPQLLLDEGEGDHVSSHHIDIDPGRQLLTDSNADDEPPQDSSVPNGQRFTKPIEHEEVFEAGEVYIHQAIHTIEFCLGCISHTASYLRLWALSLAHAQLSEVLWTMVMKAGLGFTILSVGQPYVRAISTFVVFAPFAVLTVVILLMMEGLSAFLHTLRLHWVEFNSKFYKGEGMPFEPFSYYEIISRRDVPA